ncbi:DUF2189 domain-containing protein [Chitinilyticum piscinae]|uniref:DUF2189 domain-containing protein n=1 Tax=Chitinilyticum piscinae TaxID=2866724 RepID=A0A8J7FLW0_9NEIS|nr:DUF2189 domain-containing protein [Chitinilyticum piscinae]MBE9610487.1 DUF2189 domain-containing protein [Chitinilyticum piscinae]
MDLHMDNLDRHFQMPGIRKIDAGRPLQWLGRGWQDMMRHPGPSLAYGVLVVAVGAILLALAAGYPYLLTTFVTGFLLLAPLGAAGIYELTSERDEGRETSFAQSLRDMKHNFGQLAFFGVGLGMIAIAWERTSAILFALFYGGGGVGMDAILQALTGEFLTFTLIWAGLGFVLALVVFALTAVSIPMLADRDIDAVTAMMVSLRSVGDNLVPMLIWAALLAVLTAIGFATMMIGLIVIFPWLGHATWYAYKDLVEK